jgi:hypothetical protein
MTLYAINKVLRRFGLVLVVASKYRDIFCNSLQSLSFSVQTAKSYDLQVANPTATCVSVVLPDPAPLNPQRIAIWKKE